MNGTRNDDTRNEAPGGRRRRLGGRAGQAALLAVTAGLMLATAACGSGSPSTSSTGSGGTGSASTAAYSARLAFAQCVRAHGVANYPDPESSGQEPNNAKQIAHADPQFPAASKACAHLLPNGGQSTTSGQAATDQQNAARFASCMRSHGLPNFPDATNDSQGEPSFNLTAAHIDPNSQQIRSTAQECQSQLHLSRLPSIR
jgi:hypothetical protein